MEKFMRYGAQLEIMLMDIMVGFSFFCLTTIPFSVLYFGLMGNYLVSLFFMALTLFFGLVNYMLTGKRKFI